MKSKISTILALFIFFALADYAQGSALDETDWQKAYNDASNFDLPTKRPSQTATREEAFEKLKEHCQNMRDYYLDFLEQIKGKKEKYSNLNPKTNKDMKLNNTLARLCLKNIFGFVPQKPTELHQWLDNCNIFYTVLSDDWGDTLAKLTSESILASNEDIRSTVVLQTKPNDAQKMISHLLKCRETLNIAYDTYFKHKLIGEMKNRTFLLMLDELQALHYAYQLMKPWTRSDEEIVQEQTEKEKEEKAAEKKRKARKKERERKKMKRKAARAAQPEQKLNEGAPSSLIGDSEPAVEQPLTSASAIAFLPSSQRTDNAPNDENEEAGYTYNHSDHIDWVEEQKKISNTKKEQQKEEKLAQEADEKIETSTNLASPRYYMNADNYNFFMDLFAHKKGLNFFQLSNAFENKDGLNGSVYTEGGSIHAFVLQNRSFVTHKPHPDATLRIGQRNRIIKLLAEKWDITKDNIAVGTRQEQKDVKAKVLLMSPLG